MKRIAEQLLKIRAVVINTSNPFTWASGIISPIYTDNRLIGSYPEVRGNVSKSLGRLVLEKFPDVELILGTATAGISHAALVADILNLPMGYVRSSKKEHGKQNLIEGVAIKGTKTIIIEDLFSTGKSSLQAYNAAKEAGLDVLGIVSIFTYGLKKLEDNFKGITHYSLTNANELLEVAADKRYIKEIEIAVVKDFLKGLDK